MATTKTVLQERPDMEMVSPAVHEAESVEGFGPSADLTATRRASVAA